MVEITVFTPTYNRAELLKRCYESMKSQINQNFIWMIIDDGSDDYTKELVKEWKSEEHKFELKYFYKENGGLHTAYNEAIKNIKTSLCVCVDSDDYMPNDAVEKILKFWKQNGSEKYAGIIGLDYTIEGKIIGDRLPSRKSINLIDLLIGKYQITDGDRTTVVRSELYKKYAPLQVFPGEKNFNPHYLHLQISESYDFLVLNEKLKCVEYQVGGMTASILKQYKNSPNSFAETRKLYLSFSNTSFKFKFRHSIHLVSSCILAGNVKRAIQESPCKVITLLALPFGILLAFYVNHKNK